MLVLNDIKASANGLEILSGITFTVQSGEITALIGPSGCGKTTLLNIISGIRKPDNGTCSSERCRISYMFQESRLLPWRTVRENIALVAPDKIAAEKMIKAVGLSGFENYYPDELSGGMAKRCALARAFCRGGDYYLMDEPFQALDYGIRMEMVNLLLSIWRESKPGILFVTHEIDEALTIATKIVLLSKRPSHTIEEFRLPGQEGRKASDPALSEYRERIIQCVIGETE